MKNSTSLTGSLLRISAVFAASVALTCGPRALANLSDYQTAVTNTANIISYYTFDQENGNDTFNLYNGTPVNPAWAPGVGGDGEGFLCNGQAQINYGVVTNFQFDSGTGIIEGWIRADWSGDFTAYSPTLWADGAGYPIDYSIHMEGDKSSIGFWNGSIYYPTVPVPFASTNWHHLVTVFDGGQFFLYWDGQYMGSQFKVLGANPSDFQFGSSAQSGGEGWVGMIDELAIYSSALDSNTIARHYQAFFEHTPPVIATQPAGGTFLPGVPLVLSVGATGPQLTYQWFNQTGALNGETSNTLSFGALTANDAATYHVVVSNASGSLPSIDVVVSLGTLPTQLVHYQTAVSNEAGLVADYTFDGLTGNDAFSTNTGTLAGTAIFASGVGGGAGQGVLFDGGGHVDLGPNADFAFANGGSVEAWVQASWSGVFTAYDPTLFANEDLNNSHFQWSVHMTGDKNYVYIDNGTANAIYAIPNGGAGTNWHHIAVVFDGGTNDTIYWDGASIGTIEWSQGGQVSSTEIGSSSPGSTTEGWVGEIDEVAFYTNALPGADVLAHYEAFYQGVTPTISVQPQSGNFLVGTYFVMNAQAQGAPLNIQWYKNSAPISGATNLTIYFNSLAASDSGTYYVVASNSFGSAQSINAVLSVGNNITRYQQTVRAESSLISYYTFDAGNAADSTGAHSGTNEDAVSYGPGAGGVTNEAMVLTGGGRVDIGQVSAFDFVDGGTAEAWVRADWSLSAQPGYAPCIFADRHDSTGGSVWSIHMAAAQNAIGNWNNDRFITLPVNDPGGWHHYAVTFSDGNVSMYWDGQSVGTFSQAINFFSGQTTQIGGSQPDSTTEGWIGAIDEVAFYSTPLSADDIYNHFLAMTDPTTGPTLNIAVAGNSVTISWPTALSGFTLESTPSLTNPTWTAVAGVVNNSVTVTVAGGNQFFRLNN